jgi:hypothetical protein
LAFVVSFFLTCGFALPAVPFTSPANKSVENIKIKSKPAVTAAPTSKKKIVLGKGMAQVSAQRIWYRKPYIVASGNVVFDYQGLIIRTPVLIYNFITGNVRTEQGVIFQEPGEITRGRRLIYNIKTRSGEIFSVEGKTSNIWFQGEKIRGFLFYKAKKILIKKGIISLEQGQATTCNFPWGKKHYRFSGERIKVVPGDKMVIHNGRLWIGNFPLLKLKRIVVSLKHHPRKQSYFPTFGYDQIDGFFIKTVTNYTLFDHDSGDFLFDYYQKTGLALGTDQNFHLGTKGNVSLDILQQNGTNFQHFTREQDSGSFHYNFGSLQAQGSFSLFRFNVPPIVSPENINFSGSLNRQSKNYSWSLSDNINSTAGITNSQTISYQRFQNFGNQLTLNLTENYFTAVQSGVTDSTLHNLTQISKQFKDFSVSLIYEKTNSSLFDSGFLNQLPSLTIQTNSLNFKPLNLPYQMTLTYGRYFESFNSLSADRLDFLLNIPQKIYPLGKSFKLMTAGLYQQDFYNTGNFYPTQQYSARYILGGEAQLSARLWNHFDALLDYRSQSDIGFDPLIFDIVQPYKTLSAEFSIHDDNLWRIDVGSAYDYKNKFYQELVTRLQLHPEKNWYFHFDGYYDPNLKRWDNFIAMADFWPIPKTLLNGIRLQYWVDYNIPTGQVGYQDIAITKNWHDFVGQIIYRWHMREILFSFSLKAFPQQAVQMGFNPIIESNPMMLPSTFP